MSKAGQQQRVVITGIGVLAANGIGKEAFWNALINGRSGIGPVTLCDVGDLPCRIAGEVKHFKPPVVVAPGMKSRRMGRFTLLALAAAQQAMEDSGLPMDCIRSCPRMPVVLGVSTSAMDLTGQAPRPYTAIAGIPHAAGSAIVYAHQLDARLLTISDGCASSLDAVAAAASIVRAGESEIALAGGAEGPITRYVFESMVQMGHVSVRNDDPEHASRPFDRDRDGGLIAEGAGMVFLESLEHAHARQARIYGEITGYGSVADPCDAEEGGGMGLAMQWALANAGRRPGEIDYICAHAPSDLQMDRIETKLIREVFGPHAYRMSVSSIKGVTGNPMGVSGVHQVIASALALHQDLIPPTANYEHADPECDLDYVPRTARRARLRKVLVNSHGFGRGNSSLLVERLEIP